MATRARPFPLTTRQVECVMWTWHGLSSREIGARLYISPETVKEHLRHAYRALGLARKPAQKRTLAAVWLVHECEHATGIRLGARGRTETKG